MTARAVSIEHYRTPQRGQQSARVLEYIKTHPLSTRQEIARGTRLPINCVCGRVKELIDCGAVTEPQKKICGVTGNNVHALRVPPAQQELFE